jgi:hypothetical protein
LNHFTLKIRGCNSRGFAVTHIDTDYLILLARSENFGQPMKWAALRHDKNLFEETDHILQRCSVIGSTFVLAAPESSESTAPLRLTATQCKRPQPLVAIPHLSRKRCCLSLLCFFISQLYRNLVMQATSKLFE